MLFEFTFLLKGRIAYKVKSYRKQNKVMRLSNFSFYTGFTFQLTTTKS